MRARITCTVLLVGLVVAAFLSGCGKTGPVTAGYTIAKTAAAPKIDGVLDDPCWKDLPSIDLRLSGGKKPARSTSARLAYDDTNLYVGFECEDPDAASTVTLFDGPVTGEEHVSFSISAGRDTTGYFTIAAAPTGAFSDAYVLNVAGGARTLPDWNCAKLRVSVAVYGESPRPGDRDRFWTVEMAVPFSEIVGAPHIPPRPGDLWRIGGGRLDLTGAREVSVFPHTGHTFMIAAFGK